MDFQLEIATIISNILKISTDKIYFLIKEPQKTIEADWALNCFALRSFIQQDGMDIAAQLEVELQKILKTTPFLQEVHKLGSYINFKLSWKFLFDSLSKQIFTEFNSFVHSGFSTESKLTVVIEYPSQNTNKPLHMGHIRNMVLGQTLSSIHTFAGDSVHQVNLLNDKGVHICKSMLAYKRWGKRSTPQSRNLKPDHFVGKYYVTYGKHESKLRQKVENELKLLNDEKKKPKSERDLNKINQLELIIQNSKYGKLIKQVNTMLKDWEKGDPEIRALWNMMNNWAKQGFRDTYKIFDVHHEKVYLESDIYDKGREIVMEGLEKEYFFQLSDGAVVARFDKKGLPKEKVLLRRNGTTLYITQDLYLVVQKMNDYHFDLSLYIVGNEQNMQLRTLFEILTILKFPGKNIHYSYGMIYLKSGKMKSREGVIVDADKVVEDIKRLSLYEVKNRYSDLSELEASRRAYQIAMASLRFFILKYEYTRDFVFDLEESISFEGETGAYLLYVYARICSVFSKGIEDNIRVPYDPKQNKIISWMISLTLNTISNSERDILICLSKYPTILYSLYESLKPHLLCRYLLELAQFFNNFYHECPILKETGNIRDFRLKLCEMVRTVLKHGLELIHIEVLTEM